MIVVLLAACPREEPADERSGVPPSDPSTLAPPHAGVPTDPADKATCDALERRARPLVDALSRPCSSPSDCEVVAAPCPFGCPRPISKRAPQADARAALDDFFRRCPLCKYKCDPAPTVLDCVAGECVARP